MHPAAFFALVYCGTVLATNTTSRTLSRQPRDGSSSPSLSRSQTSSTKATAVLIWETVSAGDPEYMPSVPDRFLNNNNWTGVIEILHGAFNEEIFADPAAAFRLLNVTLPFATVSQSRGALGRMSQDQLITSGSLQLLTDRKLQFTLLPDEFLQLKDDEILAIGFLANATVGDDPPSNDVLLRINASPVEPSFGFVGALGGLSVVGAGMTVTLGMPGLHQIQSLALLGAMTCTDRSVQGLTVGTEFFLSPIPLHPSAAGRLSSCIVLAVYISVLHALSCRIIRSNVARMSLREAMSRTYFPSVPYGVVVVLFPGFVYFTGGFAYQVIDGGLTVVIFSSSALAMTLLGVLVHVLHTSRSFLDRRFAFRNVGGEPAGVIERLTQPLGFWGPPEVVRMYRSVLWPLAAHSDKFLLIVFGESATVAIIASFQANTPSGCKAQFGLIALAATTFGVMYAVKAPYRLLVDNALSIVTCMALVVMAFTAAIASPEAEGVRGAYSAALGTAIAVGFLRCALTAWRSWAEFRFAAAKPQPRGERRVRVMDTDDTESIGEIPVVDSDGASSDS